MKLFKYRCIKTEFLQNQVIVKMGKKKEKSQLGKVNSSL